MTTKEFLRLWAVRIARKDDEEPRKPTALRCTGIVDAVEQLKNYEKEVR